MRVVCVCMCVSVCLCVMCIVCACLFVCLRMSLCSVFVFCVCKCLFLCVCLHVFMYCACVYMHACVYVCLCMHVCVYGCMIKQGKFLYSAVSNPQDCSKRFTLSFPRSHVQPDTISTSLGSIQPYAAINARRLLVQISTTVSSQVLIYTAE